jgi:hypothetical protein
LNCNHPTAIVPAAHVRLEEILERIIAALFAIFVVIGLSFVQNLTGR